MMMKTLPIGIVVLALALVVTACGDDGEEDRECRPCTVNENCENDQECVLAVDENLRCFELDQETCTLDRVTIGRAPAAAVE
jgi:hypothetical protein